MIQTDEERLKKWMNVMVSDFMSSEESCEDMFVIRPLPWRSFKVNIVCTFFILGYMLLSLHINLHESNEFFGRLDTTSQTLHSCQSRKMRNKRNSGEPSERPCPIAKYGKSLLWAFSRVHHPIQSPTTTPGRSRS